MNNFKVGDRVVIVDVRTLPPICYGPGCIVATDHPFTFQDLGYQTTFDQALTLYRGTLIRLDSGPMVACNGLSIVPTEAYLKTLCVIADAEGWDMTTRPWTGPEVSCE